MGAIYIHTHLLSRLPAAQPFTDIFQPPRKRADGETYRDAMSSKHPQGSPLEHCGAFISLIPGFCTISPPPSPSYAHGLVWRTPQSEAKLFFRAKYEHLHLLLLLAPQAAINSISTLHFKNTARLHLFLFVSMAVWSGRAPLPPRRLSHANMFKRWQ